MEAVEGNVAAAMAVTGSTARQHAARRGTAAAPKRGPAGAVARRQERAGVNKFDDRRMELADAALQTLAELGFARASLREIAQNSEFSHGVFHYYFVDKVDLICCAVKHYKARCVSRYDQITVTARGRDELIEGFLEKLGETLRDEAPMHRLWYELRSQALFEKAFQEDVEAIDKSLEDMVWRILARLAAFDARQPAVSPAALYALFDGLFQRHLLRQLAGDDTAAESLAEELRRLFPLVA